MLRWYFRGFSNLFSRAVCPWIVVIDRTFSVLTCSSIESSNLVFRHIGCRSMICIDSTLEFSPSRNTNRIFFGFSGCSIVWSAVPSWTLQFFCLRMAPTLFEIGTVLTVVSAHTGSGCVCYTRFASKLRVCIFQLVWVSWTRLVRRLPF